MRAEQTEKDAEETKTVRKRRRKRTRVLGGGKDKRRGWDGGGEGEGGAGRKLARGTEKSVSEFLYTCFTLTIILFRAVSLLMKNDRHRLRGTEGAEERRKPVVYIHSLILFQEQKYPQ